MTARKLPAKTVKPRAAKKGAKARVSARAMEPVPAAPRAQANMLPFMVRAIQRLTQIRTLIMTTVDEAIDELSRMSGLVDASTPTPGQARALSLTRSFQNLPATVSTAATPREDLPSGPLPTGRLEVPRKFGGVGPNGVEIPGAAMGDPSVMGAMPERRPSVLMEQMRRQQEQSDAARKAELAGTVAGSIPKKKRAAKRPARKAKP